MLWFVRFGFYCNVLLLLILVLLHGVLYSITKIRILEYNLHKTVFRLFDRHCDESDLYLRRRVPINFLLKFDSTASYLFLNIPKRSNHPLDAMKNDNITSEYRLGRTFTDTLDVILSFDLF